MERASSSVCLRNSSTYRTVSLLIVFFFWKECATIWASLTGETNLSHWWDRIVSLVRQADETGRVAWYGWACGMIRQLVWFDETGCFVVAVRLCWLSVSCNVRWTLFWKTFYKMHEMCALLGVLRSVIGRKWCFGLWKRGAEVGFVIDFFAEKTFYYTFNNI